MWDLLAVFVNVGLEVEAAPPRWGIQMNTTFFSFIILTLWLINLNQVVVRQNLLLKFYFVMKTQRCCSKIKLQQPIWLPFLKLAMGNV